MDSRNTKEARRALAYLARKAKRDLASIEREVASTFAEIEDRLENLNPKLVQVHPVEGGWSVLEVVDHLVESHRPSLRQIEAVLVGQSPGDAVPAHLRSVGSQTLSWDRRLADLKEVHRGVLKCLDGAVSDDVAIKIPIVMVLKVDVEGSGTQIVEWVEELEWKAFVVGIRVHTLEHLAQIERLVRAVAPPS